MSDDNSREYHTGNVGVYTAMLYYHIFFGNNAEFSCVMKA
jgi:hypothetical protein